MGESDVSIPSTLDPQQLLHAKYKETIKMISEEITIRIFIFIIYIIFYIIFIFHFLIP